MISKFAIAFAMYFCMVMVFSETGSAMENKKINICEHSAKDIKEFELELRDIILNQNITDLASVFVNTPYGPQYTKKVNPSAHKFTGIPLGKVHSIPFSCPVSHGNSNNWLLATLEEETGEVTKLDLHLFYEDEDFSKRGEMLSAHRFANSAEIIKAVTRIGKATSKTQEEFRNEMLAGGFLLHMSCRRKEVNSDIYVTPPVPPTSIRALLGIYLSPDVGPNVAMTFSPETGEFLHAKLATGKGSGKCTASHELYREQTEDWLNVNYPNSWISKLIQRSKHR